MARNKGVQRKLYKNLNKTKEKTKISSVEPQKKERVKPKKSSYTGLKGFYLNNLNKLIIIPILIILASLVSLGMTYSTTGELFDKDVSLEGGLTITLNRADIDMDALESHLQSRYSANDVSLRELKAQGATFGVIVEAATTIDPKEMRASIEEHTGALETEEISVEITGSALGKQFFRQLMRAMIYAFICMGLVVMIFFRAFVPAGAVVVAALCDIIGTLAIVNMLGMRLSSAGIAAFLMLVGYAVDTNILLSSRLLKQKEGTLEQRLFSAIKPGILMSMTTLAVVGVGMVLSQAETLKQIMTIVFVGLLLDMVNTWIQNACILYSYAKKKGGN